MHKEQVQTVPQNMLEQKVGHKLSVDETFETKTGRWKVIAIGEKTYTVERRYDATRSR